LKFTSLITTRRHEGK